MTTCAITGKVVYPSPQAAFGTVRHLASATRLRRGKRSKHRALSALCAYRCTCCKGWHVGHSA